MLLVLPNQDGRRAWSQADAPSSSAGHTHCGLGGRESPGALENKRQDLDLGGWPGDGMELETGRMEMLEPSQTLSAWPRVGRDESHGSTVRHGHRRARAWRRTSRDRRSHTAGSDRFSIPQLSPQL